MATRHDIGDITDIPRAKINQAYAAAIEARDTYTDMVVSDVDQEFVRMAHTELNRATMRFLGTMKYLLKRKDGVAKYWHGRAPAEGDPWTAGDAFLFVKTRHRPVSANDDYQQLLADLPDYAETSLVERYRNQMIIGIQEPVFGLKHLEHHWQNTQTVSRSKSGLLGTRQQSQEVHDKLPPKVLVNAIDAITEAADELGLMVDVEQTRSRYHAGDEDTNEYPEPHGTAAKPK